MSRRQEHVAIDLGAGSGRVFLGHLGDEGLRFAEVHRFTYAPRESQGHLRWDMTRLLGGIEEGLRLAGERASAAGVRLASAGVDSWGVDYGYVDASGHLLQEPVCYRDPRTGPMMDAVFARIPKRELFGRTGIQMMVFNTVFQLAADVAEGLPAGAARFLMMPDLCHRHLCGSESCELTNASTTQLLDARTQGWDDELFARLDLPRHLMPEIVMAGVTLGELTPSLRDRLGLGPLRIVAPATHDTGSAIAGTPLAPGWAYISSGTWSLVGIEHESPLLGDEAAGANLTNEIGANRKIRLLRNVMGLWVLDSCRREWDAAGESVPLSQLLQQVSEVQGFPGFIYPDAARFFNPTSMVTEVQAALHADAQHPTTDRVALAKVVLDSLALRYASTIATLERLTGRPVPGVHVVGGGSQNDYLNQATANATQKPVTAGPVEAAVCGNLLVQAIASGDITSVEEGRERLARGLTLRRYEPRDAKAWEGALARYHSIEANAQTR
jgi:rhamnulokinase